ncbi:hypothetical protein AB4P95_19995 [Pseudomonas sp. A1437]|uniref:DUF6998 domain-containing protein n=1 Tax=unclassified Pseudomonas TaxID=196821 RepID=UPI003784E2E3
MITADRIQQLFDQYFDLLLLETAEFGVRPTELSHLTGRIGEFYCALQVGGTLAHITNQHGFDVICRNGRRISVKTTAQLTGFVPIGKSTLGKVDDLMIIQYNEGALFTIYYGPIGPAVAAARYYAPDGKYELDITKARRLMAASAPLPLTSFTAAEQIECSSSTATGSVLNQGPALIQSMETGSLI